MSRVISFHGTLRGLIDSNKAPGSCWEGGGGMNGLLGSPSSHFAQLYLCCVTSACVCVA